MPDTTVPNIRVTGPGQLVATIPALLGFHPTESLVVVFLEGRLVRCTMRVDITDGVLSRADRIAAVAQRAGATSVLLVVYAATGPAWAEEIMATAALLAEDGVTVADALHVDQGRYLSYLCTDSSCCPQDGQEVPQEVCELEVHRVARGSLAVAGSRQEVADLYQPRPDLAPSEAVYARQMSVSALPLAERCAQAVTDTGDLLRTCQTTSPVASDGDDTRARLGLLLGDCTVRDHLLAVLARDHDLLAAAHALTWLALTTAPVHRPPVAATAACLQLAVGDDAVATWALLDLADGESPAALLRAGMEHGVRPDQVRDLLLEALPPSGSRSPPADPSHPLPVTDLVAGFVMSGRHSLSNPFTQIHRAVDHLIDWASEALQHLLDRLRAAWHRHLNFMQNGDAYRAQVVAAVAAVVAVFELDPRAAAVLVALLGLHAAAFGHGPRSLRPRPLFDDDRWDPFS